MATGSPRLGRLVALALTLLASARALGAPPPPAPRRGQCFRPAGAAPPPTPAAAAAAAAAPPPAAARASLGRRSALSRASAVAAGAAAAAAAPVPLVAPGGSASAAVGPEAAWPLWPALPVFPYARRKTIRREVGPGVWAFDQLIGIYYVHVPIRMTVVRLDAGGLFVYAPVAPTKECLALLAPLVAAHGPVRCIVLPSVAVEHKVLAGPFARAFPDADFYAVDQQYSFPVPLPGRFLGLPRWTKPLPRSGAGLPGGGLCGGELAHEVLTVKPGPGSFFQDVAVVHRPSRTLLICDAVLGVTDEPPAILTSDPEYVRALLFHARDAPTEQVADSPAARRKGWRRIVLLFNFFIPGATQADVGLGPLGRLDPRFPLGWGGWQPFAWRADDEAESFARYSRGGAPTLLPIVQIILARGAADGSVARWVDAVSAWGFDRVVPAHLDAPLAAGPREFAAAFDFVREKGELAAGNAVRFCDEDVALLREAERGPLAFSVGPTPLGPLRGEPCGLGGGEPRVVSRELNLRWTPPSP